MLISTSRSCWQRLVAVAATGLLLGACTTGTGESPPAEVAIDDGDVGPASDDGPPTDSGPDAVTPSPSTTSSPVASPSPSPTDASAAPSASPRGDDAPVVARGRVVDVVDGDTLDLGDGTTVRIAIADTPEVSGGVEDCGPAASDFTADFVAGRAVAVHRPSDAPLYDPFDRLLGEVVRVSDGASLNVALVAAGLATIDERFTDEDPDLARRLRAAARAADVPDCATRPGEPPVPAPQPGAGESGVTIATVRQDGPGNDVEVYNDSEYVQLRNDSDADVDVSGWRIVDLADNSVTIGRGFTIPASGTFRVYSGAGDDDPRSRYYAGRDQAYLNNSGGDTIRLLDRSGAEVDSYSW